MDALFHWMNARSGFAFYVYCLKSISMAMWKYSWELTICIFYTQKVKICLEKNVYRNSDGQIDHQIIHTSSNLYTPWYLVKCLLGSCGKLEHFLLPSTWVWYIIGHLTSTSIRNWHFHWFVSWYDLSTSLKVCELLKAKKCQEINQSNKSLAHLLEGLDLGHFGNLRL